jgi:leucyl aminopeptidase
MHLDVAGTAMGSPQTEINRSWASGWGVRGCSTGTAHMAADSYESAESV